MTAYNKNGYIIYEGPSRIDQKPIVVIATGFKGSANPKTGQMIQTYILRSDMPPVQATKTGDDASICGNCKHRGFFGKRRSCYVNVGQAPTAVYNAYKKGRYEKIDPINTIPPIKELFEDRALRIGSYGDPTSVPWAIWDSIGYWTKTTTGYTHFWKDKNNNAYKRFCMASVDTEEEYKKARKDQWRTFRVKLPEEPRLEGEATCPATLGNTTCEKCRLCSGDRIQLNNLASNKVNVVLDVHGAQWKVDEYKSIIQK